MSDPQQEPRIVTGWSKDRDEPRKPYFGAGCPACGAGKDRIDSTFGGRYCKACGHMQEETNG